MSNRAWSVNTAAGVLGLGVGNSTIYRTPQAMASAPDFTQIIMTLNSGGSVFGLAADGTVYAWGDNSLGQLATGSTDSSAHATPAQIAGLSNIVKIATANGSGFALTNTGDLYAWGQNQDGCLGLGDTTRRTSPVLTATGVVDVAGGGHAIILTSGGAVQTTGFNSQGQLGTGNTTSQSSWQTVTPASGTVARVYALLSTTLLLFADGSVSGWGGSANGELGLIQSINTSLTTLSISNVVDIGCGGNQEFFILNDGTVWAQGLNTSGCLGVGQTSAALPRTSSPLQQTWPSGVSPTSIAYGVCTDGTIRGAFNALGSDHLAYTWGDNSLGQMGDGGSTASTSPETVNGLVYVRVVGGGCERMFAEALDSVPAGRSWGTIVG